MFVKWLTLCSLCLMGVVRQPTVLVRVTGGLLRGEIARDGSHKAYYGVPYATVTNRFQAATPNMRWEGVFEATEEAVRCTQRLTSTTILGQEDCLTLNIYTPLDSQDRLRPVLVFLHGGGFRDGSNSPILYGPEYLVKQGIILVTVNYRLEVLGFLCLGIKEAPGNAGLKDQVEALKWIQKNIKQFGGDPDNVTIFGESAGSAAVSYHLISPMSEGLFHKAIMQSGSAISPWSFQFEPVQTARLLANQMGHNTEDPYELYKLFINKTAKELLLTRIPRAEGDVVLSENVFVPCMEKSIPGVDQFLPDRPYNLMSKGKFHKVPVLIGYNNAEGYMFVGKENDTTISKLNFYNALPRDLQFSTENEKIKTAQTLQKLYMGEEQISKESLPTFAHYAGESGITYSVVATIDLLLKTTEVPVYGYKFCYDGWLNIAKIFFGYGKAPGATHADELFYMFKLKLDLPNAFIERGEWLKRSPLCGRTSRNTASPRRK